LPNKSFLLHLLIPPLLTLLSPPEKNHNLVVEHTEVLAVTGKPSKFILYSLPFFLTLEGSRTDEYKRFSHGNVTENYRECMWRHGCDPDDGPDVGVDLD
jgi:hypothetical protein